MQNCSELPTLVSQSGWCRNDHHCSACTLPVYIALQTCNTLCTIYYYNIITMLLCYYAALILQTSNIANHGLRSFAAVGSSTWNTSSRTPKPATLCCVLPSSSEDCTVLQSIQYFISTLVTVSNCKSGRTLTLLTYLLTYLMPWHLTLAVYSCIQTLRSSNISQTLHGETPLKISIITLVIIITITHLLSSYCIYCHPTAICIDQASQSE